MTFAIPQRRAALSQGTPFETSSYAVTGATSSSLKLTTDDGGAVSVDWGDGTIVDCASGATVSRTYASAYTGSIKTTAKSKATKVTRLESSSGGWSFNISSLPPALTLVTIAASNTVTGNLSSIPNATSITIIGSNTVTGNLSSIPNATYVYIAGSNTVTGNLSSIPNATYINIAGSNTVTGNLSSIPNATYINIAGSNTVTGNLSSIPNATYVYITGSNTVTGNLSSIPNATFVTITGSNTVTGNLSSIPNATFVTITGSNTVTGNLSSIPNATYINIAGSNTVTFSGAWTQTPMRQVYVRSSTTVWGTTETDALLNALAATATTWTNEKIVNIHGSRTSASDAAVTTLQGRGVSITVN